MAQDSDLFDKAPPQIDEALRARVTTFYDAHVSGRFRDAFKVVADDSQDAFLGASKDQFSKCDISKIKYTENFTHAVVTTACKGEYRWHGSHMPVTIPLLSNWKVVDGQWFWFHIKETETKTPWGISRATPENSSGPAKMPNIPTDPRAAAMDILNKVAVDKTDLRLKSFELSKGEVHITNAMPGSISINVDRVPLPGVSSKVDHADLETGQKATITFTYDPKDPAIACETCSTKAGLPVVTANIRIVPTGQVFPVQISFEAPPKTEKQLPKLPTDKN